MLWEIVKTEEHAKNGVQRLHKRLPNITSDTRKSFASDHDKLAMSLAHSGMSKTQRKQSMKFFKRDHKPTGDELLEMELARFNIDTSQFRHKDYDSNKRNQENIDLILLQISKRNALSTPDVKTDNDLEPGSSKNLAKKANSDVPLTEQFQPGSTSQKFLTDDFGVSQHQLEARARGRESPHPHHFNHPEKHISLTALHSGLVRSRSSSSMSSLIQLRKKTPPSPHHHDHPLNTLLGNRNAKSEPSKDPKKTPKPLLKKAVSDSKKKKPLGQSKPKEPEPKEDEKHIKWDNIMKDSGLENLSAIEWNELSVQEAERRANDQMVELPAEKNMIEKRKGDYTHIPLGKVSVDITGFFLDKLEAQTRIASGIEGLSKCEIILKLDAPLLSEEQGLRLNPICVTIETASNMPNEPLSYDMLDEKCLPVFTKFRFFNDLSVHSAISNSSHGPQMVFQSQHLVLAGLIDIKKLRDEIVKNPLVIEVHDRDHRLPDDLTNINASLRNDGVINASMNPRNPFGAASFKLTELCSGMTELELTAPIVPGRSPVSKSRRSLPGALWLESSATLSIRITARHPLVPPTMHQELMLSAEPYGHVIIVADSRNGSIARLLHEVVTDHNADVLRIPPTASRRDLALSTYQLTEDQKQSELNLITGFDIFDYETRVVFIEGLIDGGIKKVFGALESLSDKSNVKVWHSPDVTFHRPCLPGLTPVVTHIQVVPGIKEILANKTTYIRDRLSGDSFDCISLINEVRTNKLVEKAALNKLTCI